MVIKMSKDKVPEIKDDDIDWEEYRKEAETVDTYGDEWYDSQLK